ncbi:MAG: hypothetical protein QM805_07600 [Pseudomonas sp.]
MTPDPLEEETCCVCHIRFGMPRSFQQDARKNSSIYFCCPNGHRQHYNDEVNEREKLRRERDMLKQNAAYLEDRNRELEAAATRSQRQAVAYKGVATKMKNRVKNGVCPCCNRTFVDLARHMHMQHPEFDNVVRDAALSG